MDIAVIANPSPILCNFRGDFFLRPTSCSVAWRAREEGVGSPNVITIGGTPFGNRGLQQTNPRNADQEDAHQQRAENGPPRSTTGRDEIDSPPDAKIAEIVGVSRVAPQALIEDLAAICRIGFEAG